MEKMTYKIVLGSILTALSIGIRLFFDYLIPTGGNFGLPLYSIPLIIASLMLGPSYGILIGILADLGNLMGPHSYLPLFGLSTLAWAVIPGIIARKNYNFLKIAIAIMISYLVASSLNTVAIIVYFNSKTALGSLAIRIPILLTSTPPLIYICHLIYTRILEYQQKDLKLSKSEKII